jgi:hypothetical protein
MIRGSHQLLYDALGNQETMTKTTTETTSHRTASELRSCLQYRHGRHSSTTPCHATMWPQDHDDSHAQTYSTRRQSLQAKLARTSRRLATPQLGEPPLYTSHVPELYIRVARAPISTFILNLLPFHSFSIVAGLLELHSK